MKEKEMYASFAAVPQAAKVMTTVFGKCLVKIEKALVKGTIHNFWHPLGALEGIPCR